MMLKKILYIVPAFFIMCSSPNAPEKQQRAWQALNSGLPETVTVNCIAAGSNAPLTLYIGTFQGVFKKVGNAEWQQKNSGLEILDISTLTVDPQQPATLYAGTWGKGVFKSTNAGESWTSIWSSDFNPHINDVLVKNSNELWVATENGLYHSSDAGAQWSLLRFGGIKTVAMMGNTLYIGVNVSGNFRSVDGGATWQEINNGVHHDDLSYAAANCFQFTESAVLMSTEWVDLYISQNNGDLWQQLGQEIKYKSVQTFQIDPNDSNRLWAVCKDDGVYKSTNGGESWFALNDNLGSLNVKSLIVVGSIPTIYAGTLGKGIYRYVEEE